LLERVEQAGAPGEGSVAALDVEELTDELEMQPVVAAQLGELGDLGRSDGEVVIERAAREVGAGDLAVHDGKSVLDLVLVDHPDAADLVQLGERDELEVADRCGAVGAYPGLGFEDAAQPVLAGR